MNYKVDAFGNKFWYNENGKLHRGDGPAIECASGSRWWFTNGKRHRENGAAIEYSNGEKAWFYHGKRIKCRSQEEFEKIIKLKAFW